jgi:molybdate transport system substrate-binding protein
MENSPRYKKQNSWPLVAFFSLIVIVVLFVALNNKDNPKTRNGFSSDTDQALTVYCAAGVRKAVEEVAKKFEQEMGYPVALEYANSGVLENRLYQDKEAGLDNADLYIPADYVFTDRAKSRGVTAEAFQVATWKVVLGVKPGLGLDIKAATDILDQEISFVICDPLAGVGKKTKKHLSQSGVWERINDAKSASFPTVTEAAHAVKENAGTQAAFVWDTIARQMGLDIIELPELEGSLSKITVGVTSTSAQPTKALQFARYLHAPEKGGKVFARHEYKPLPGDKWAVTPELRIDCGGVNREAVQRTITEFQEREGCVVDVVYAGCGTLVGKMQTGDQGLPDLFVTCDASYMDKAQIALGNPFGTDVRLSSTPIVLLVKKGNPHEVQKLEDLAKPGIKVGTTDPAASTLGDISHQLIKATGKFPEVEKNIVMMADTAHTLIQSMEAGEKLDVVMVYEANIQHLNDRFDYITLTQDMATAVQNVAAKKDTDFPNLAERLMSVLASADSKRRFEQLGFKWVGPSN